METNKLKAGIAEDQSNLRKRLLEHFRYYPEVDVTIACESGNALLERLPKLTKELLPDIILMDIEMPGFNGIETTFRVKEQYPQIDVIMFTVFEDDERIFEAIRAGASGYLLKDEPIDRIVEAMQELRVGGAPMSSLIARKTLSLMRRAEVPASPVNQEETPFDLTAREVEIIEHIVSGKTTAEIGKTLFLSPLTIKTHIKNIYRKMHVGSRAEVTSVAYRSKLVTHSA